MNNNTNQTTTSKRGKSNTGDFKGRRRITKKENIGLGIQSTSLKDCNYGWSSNGTELVKLDFEHLETGVIETFNFINGSAALDAVMDVLDETGELDIDFKDYIGEKMNVEVVEAGRFRNIINAWVLEEIGDKDEEEEAYEDDEDFDEDIIIYQAEDQRHMIDEMFENDEVED